MSSDIVIGVSSQFSPKQPAVRVLNLCKSSGERVKKGVCKKGAYGLMNFQYKAVLCHAHFKTVVSTTRVNARSSGQYLSRRKLWFSPEVLWSDERDGFPNLHRNLLIEHRYSFA